MKDEIIQNFDVEKFVNDLLKDTTNYGNSETKFSYHDGEDYEKGVLGYTTCGDLVYGDSGTKLMAVSSSPNLNECIDYFERAITFNDNNTKFSSRITCLYNCAFFVDMDEGSELTISKESIIDFIKYLKEKSPDILLLECSTRKLSMWYNSCISFLSSEGIILKQYKDKNNRIFVFEYEKNKTRVICLKEFTDCKEDIKQLINGPHSSLDYIIPKYEKAVSKFFKNDLLVNNRLHEAIVHAIKACMHDFESDINKKKYTQKQNWYGILYLALKVTGIGQKGKDHSLFVDICKEIFGEDIGNNAHEFLNKLKFYEVIDSKNIMYKEVKQYQVGHFRDERGHEEKAYIEIEGKKMCKFAKDQNGIIFPFDYKNDKIQPKEWCEKKADLVDMNLSTDHTVEKSKRPKNNLTFYRKIHYYDVSCPKQVSTALKYYDGRDVIRENFKIIFVNMYDKLIKGLNAVYIGEE